MDKDLPHSLKLVTVWLLVGAAVFVAIQWWQHRAQQTRFQVSGGTLEIAAATMATTTGRAGLTAGPSTS